jgi:hypothetical protein
MEVAVGTTVREYVLTPKEDKVTEVTMAEAESSS